MVLERFIVVDIVIRSVCLMVSLVWCVVTDDLSSGGDSRADDDQDKKSPKDKDSKDRERDREEGLCLLIIGH